MMTCCDTAIFAQLLDIQQFTADYRPLHHQFSPEVFKRMYLRICKQMHSNDFCNRMDLFPTDYIKANTTAVFWKENG